MLPYDVLAAEVQFLGVVVGHVALVIRSHNWWYGSALGRRTVDVLQILHALVLLAGPVGLWLVIGFRLEKEPFSEVRVWHEYLLVYYVQLCWLVGFVVMPGVTAVRLLRRCPALISEEKTTIRMATLLGHSPAGDGKHPWLARLPFNQALEVELSVKTLRLPRLPAEWEGLTILHLSDFHFCGTPGQEYHEKVVELCQEWHSGPDIIALSGDYVDSLAHHAWLVPVLGRLHGRESKLAILGNHDHWYEPELVRDQLRAMGFVTPRNAWQTIEVRGRPMVVIGQESPWLKPMPDLTACPTDVFRLCLSHTPDNIGWARRNDIDLMLSGHVHGGQVRLPVIGSIVVPSRHGRRYDCGTFDVGPTVLHVSRGVAGEHPLRFNCRPEATLLVLRCSPHET